MGVYGTVLGRGGTDSLVGQSHVDVEIFSVEISGVGKVAGMQLSSCRAAMDINRPVIFLATYMTCFDVFPLALSAANKTPVMSTEDEVTPLIECDVGTSTDSDMPNFHRTSGPHAHV